MPVAKITSIYSPWTDHLETYKPKSPKNFGLGVHFFLSFEGEEYRDRFALFVCTLEWLEERLSGRGFISGSNMLIVSRYDFKQIAAYINDLVKRFDEDDFKIIARKIHGFAEWEGWDYPFKQVR
ncbi:hypothetical protein BH24DEI2_BH24DEI2_19210 [soil metagenome]